MPDPGVLLGETVRYNGGAATSGDPLVQRWLAEGRVVSFSPEAAGGLGTPRPRAERQNDLVVTDAGVDVTNAFTRGAELAHHIRIAILKDGSPSCGSTYVYDGTLIGTLAATA